MTKCETPNKKLPPSKSLSSPFPIQFRQRSASVSSLQISTDPSDDSNAENQPMTPQVPRGCSVATVMETITSPIPLNRIASFPSALPSPSRLALCARASPGDLPPPCPGAARRRRPSLVTTMSPLRSRKTKRVLRQLKTSRQNARITSVLDMEEESEDDDGSEEDSISSDEDDLGVVLEQQL
jgi:hypothetical protein